MTMSGFKPEHFNWAAKNGIAVITLKGAERKNPITFESYVELVQAFRELARVRDIKGACALLPRVIGHGRASELLYIGRVITAEEGERCGFFNRLVAPDKLEADAMTLAQQLASGPTFAHGMTKTMLHHDFAMPLDDAIETEAIAQAVCMQTKDFRRAYEAFVAKQKPQFAGN
jgi:enoyl-CoA hydratase/carnithine racemase